MSDVSSTIAADQVSYEDLYARWEQGNWRASEIDFSVDRTQWLETFTQVDEVRHAVLFARFMREVAGAGADTASSLEATRPELTWGFRKVFERLDRMRTSFAATSPSPSLPRRSRFTIS